MPNISYVAQNFPAALHPALIGQHTLEVSWRELAWAAITVGRAELPHVFQHGEFSLFEIVYRLAILYANLYQTNDGFIRKTSAYEGLDPSAKSAISYFLGMTLTKLVAHRLMDVPWLMHLDVYRHRLAPVTQGNSRPDLVGQNSNQQWVVLESKGRTNEMDAAALERAKEQASELVSVGGTEPILHVGAVTHFAGGHLGIHLDDPPVSKKRRLKIALKPEELRADYYRPFVGLFKDLSTYSSKQRGARNYRLVRAESVDAWIGMSSDLLQDPAALALHANPQQGADEIGFEGKDGIRIELGELWSSQNMRLEPQERSR